MKVSIDIFDERTNWKWSPEDFDQFLPGTQSSLVQLARQFVKHGHGVTVFYEGPECEDRGVHYRPRKVYDGKSQVMIGCNHPASIPENFWAERVLYWTNGPEIWPNLQQGERYSYDGIDWVIGLSKWHEQELKTNLPHISEKIISIGYGLDPEEFSQTITMTKTPAKIPLQFLFASSWDRGLFSLLGSWPKIHAALPKSKLIITYGQDFSSKVAGRTLDPMPGLKQPGIELRGQVSRSEMAKLYEESDFLLYPCNGGERFCLTTWKAQYARCYPIVIPVMALDETVVAGWKPGRGRFVDIAILVAKQNAASRKAMDKIRDPMVFPSWDTIAQNWERLFQSVADTNEPAPV